MKRIRQVTVWACGVLVLAPAWGQSCPAGTTRVNQVIQLVGGNTMCASRGSDSWQEYHQGTGNSGDLIDYKLGPGHRIDPTKKVGTWSALNGANSSVTHTYGSTSYTWLVCDAGGGSYTLVSTGNAGTVTGVTMRTGQVPCAGTAAAPARSVGGANRR